MRVAAALSLLALAGASIPAPVLAADDAPQPVFDIMGPSDCARWPARARMDSAAKAVPLNWALGFLSGVAEQADAKLFDLIQADKVSAWLDTYCQANPDASLPGAVRALEKELEAQLPPPPPPMFFTPPTAPAPPPPAAKAAPAKAAPRRPAPQRATTARPRPAAPVLRR